MTRVQATGKVLADSAPAVSLTFGTLPTVGNGLVVPVSLYSALPPASCGDNRGHPAYTLAKYQAGNTNASVAIYYLPIITASAAPFTITVSVGSGSRFFAASAIEVGGVGTGLVLDRTAGALSAPSTAPATGATAALTAAEALLVAVNGVSATQASITVQVVSPVWTEELEELNFAHAVGEADSRIVTGALGTTPSCSWTLSASTYWAAAIAAFKAGGAAAVERVQTYVVLP